MNNKKCRRSLTGLKEYSWEGPCSKLSDPNFSDPELIRLAWQFSGLKLNNSNWLSWFHSLFQRKVKKCTDPPSWALRNTLAPYWVIRYNLAQSWSIALVASLVILIVLTLNWAIGNDLAISSEQCLKFCLESKTPNWMIITDLVRFGPPELNSLNSAIKS